MFASLLAGNAGLALLAAFLWGIGDFAGGMAVRFTGGGARSALRVILLSHGISLTVLLTLALARGDRLPHGPAIVWALFAGVLGGLSLTAFYVALARGGMGVSAALSGLLAAAIPAVVSALTEGAPAGLRLVGFAVAGAAIWLIAAGPSGTADGTDGTDRRTLLLALAAGAGFGLYFVAIRQAGHAGLFLPMALVRVGSLSTAGVALALLRTRPADEREAPRWNRPAVLWAVATAAGDTCGNLLFLAATQAGRLDVAAVLASLYPASTVVMAALLLHERPTARQGWGMAVAAAAVILVTL